MPENREDRAIVSHLTHKGALKMVANTTCRELAIPEECLFPAWRLEEAAQGAVAEVLEKRFAFLGGTRRVHSVDLFSKKFWTRRCGAIHDVTMRKSQIADILISTMPRWRVVAPFSSVSI